MGFRFNLAGFFEPFVPDSDGLHVIAWYIAIGLVVTIVLTVGMIAGWACK